MARFYQRSNGWAFTVEVGKDKDGKRKRITKDGFKTKKAAQTQATEIENNLAKGIIVEETNLTFRECAKQWVDRYAVDAKPGATRIRKNEIERLQKYFDATPIKDITKKQYQDALYDMMLVKGYAENTVAGTHTTARMIFKEVVSLDLLRKDPTENVRAPRKRKTLEEVEAEDAIPKYLEKKDLAHFLKITHDAGLSQDYAIFITLAYTGIRAGELCALKWTDVDLKEKTMSITKTYYNPNNNLRQYELETPKTKASKRIISISDTVVRELTLHQARQNKQNLLHRDVWHDEKFIFTCKYPGYPAYVKMIENRMKRILKLCDLPQELTPHSLRHTHTSLLAEAGVSLEEIMERLGHIDDKTTRQVYLHVTKEMKKEAAHKFEQLMNNL